MMSIICEEVLNKLHGQVQTYLIIQSLYSEDEERHSPVKCVVHLIHLFLLFHRPAINVTNDLTYAAQWRLLSSYGTCLKF
jgi:hypothetical protein